MVEILFATDVYSGGCDRFISIVSRFRGEAAVEIQADHWLDIGVDGYPPDDAVARTGSLENIQDHFQNINFAFSYSFKKSLARHCLLCLAVRIAYYTEFPHSLKFSHSYFTRSMSF